MGPAPPIASLTAVAVICAAGASSRMGGIKKEYRPLPNSDGLTVLGAAVTAFARVPEITSIVIVVPDDPENGDDATAARNALPPELLAGKDSPVIRFVTGGATRQASVFNALCLLADCPRARRIPGETNTLPKQPNVDEPVNYVLIHDGARPWVSPSLIQRVIAAVKKHHAVIPLLPLTETPKETDVPVDNGSDNNPVFIKQHLKRSVVGAAQTPQGFDFPAIFFAHVKAAEQNPNYEYTDDAEIWAAFEGPVAAILGETENRKITFPEDLPAPESAGPAPGGAGC